MRRWGTRQLAESGVAVALAAALGMVKVYQLPQGGSITAGSMVPVLALSLRWGAWTGTVAGVLLGLVNFALEPVFLHPVQFLLDYPLAFGALGLAGFFPKTPWLGVVTGGAARFVSHFLSGVVFFAQYAPRGTSPALYSALYNGSYMLPEVVVSTVLTVLVLKALPAPDR